MCLEEQELTISTFGLFINKIIFEGQEKLRTVLEVPWDIGCVYSTLMLRARVRPPPPPSHYRQRLCTETLYSNSVFLVLNETSLNSENALLALNWWYVYSLSSHEALPLKIKCESKKTEERKRRKRKRKKKCESQMRFLLPWALTCFFKPHGMLNQITSYSVWLLRLACCLNPRVGWSMCYTDLQQIQEYWASPVWSTKGNDNVSTTFYQVKQKKGNNHQLASASERIWMILKTLNMSMFHILKKYLLCVRIWYY